MRRNFSTCLYWFRMYKGERIVRVKKPGPISCKGHKIQHRNHPLDNLQQRFRFVNIGAGGKVVDKRDFKETVWESVDRIVVDLNSDK